MVQLSKSNIDTIKQAVEKGFISPGIAIAFYEKSAKGKTSLSDIQFIFSLMKLLIAGNKKFKKFKK